MPNHPLAAAALPLPMIPCDAASAACILRSWGSVSLKWAPTCAGPGDARSRSEPRGPALATDLRTWHEATKRSPAAERLKVVQGQRPLKFKASRRRLRFGAGTIQPNGNKDFSKKMEQHRVPLACHPVVVLAFGLRQHICPALKN